VDRLYFYQLSPDTPLIQCRRDFQIEQVLVPNERYIEPSASEKENLIARYFTESKLDEENKGKTDDELKLLALQRLESSIEDEREKMVDVTKACYTPIPADQKLQAYLDIKKFSQTLGVDVNKQFAYFVIGVVALVIVGVIVFYIAINKGDVPILTK
jgi:hypothetical protein